MAKAPGTRKTASRAGPICRTHCNTLRGLIKYAERISDKDIADLNIPTAKPLVYELEDDMKLIRRYYLGDQDAVEKAAEAVAEQSKAKT